LGTDLTAQKREAFWERSSWPKYGQLMHTSVSV